jgi:hypothetical protein
MKRKEKNNKSEKPRSENPLPGEISSDQRKQNENAHEQADNDISKDAEFSAHSENDDLDEGETARLGEDKNDLI